MAVSSSTLSSGLASNTESEAVTCPALFISAPASGQGKTTVTAALARYYKQKGKRVTVFKTGPDYLDPQILEQASGRPVRQLDLWMAGEQYCREMLFQAAKNSDLILVEGVMGLFDGDSSSADLAALFGIPVALVMDVKGMAQTTAAVVHGLASYRDDISVIGLVANKCGSQRHAELIQEALPANIKLLATLARDEQTELPERHLGLVQAHEVKDELEDRFNHGAQGLIHGGIETLESSGLFETLLTVSFRSPVSKAEDTYSSVRGLLNGARIAIAKDQAFSFVYSANVECLQAMGAECIYFSPLNDEVMPEATALWLPGGYPELHAAALSKNQSMLTSIRDFYQQGFPILAECGGFLYCLDSLTDLDNQNYEMLGLLNGEGAMKGKRGCQGMQTAVFPEGEVKAHSHHRSRCETSLTPISHGRRQRHPAPGEAIFRQKGLTASYLHLFFPSNPEAVAGLFSKINSDEINDFSVKEVNHAF